MSSLDCSVSMCVYGGDDAAQFDAAFESIVQQTLPPKEIILVVDGPIPKEIEQIISKYNELLEKTGIDYKVLRLAKNKGHGEARRISFENCSCPVIAIMDADDLSVSNRFEKQVQYLANHPEIAVVGGHITEFVGNADPKDTSHFAGQRIVPTEDKQIKAYMRKRCPMNQVTAMFRKQDIVEVGGYQDWYCEEDYYLWIRMALAGKSFGNLPEVLVKVRVGDDMYQRRGGTKYFISEARLQRFMHKKGMIGVCRYGINVSERFILQVLMPNKLRGWVFHHFARSKAGSSNDEEI